MKPNKNQISEKNERKTAFLERKNPIIRIVYLVNQYHSIDLMEATKEEKEWAKERLSEEIRLASHTVSPSTRGLIRSCMKNKDLWETTRASWT